MYLFGFKAFELKKYKKVINVSVYTSLVSPITTESPFPKNAHNICNSARGGGGDNHGFDKIYFVTILESLIIVFVFRDTRNPNLSRLIFLIF